MATADAPEQLRELCISVAEGIYAECRAVLASESGLPARQDGSAQEDHIKAVDGLAGCGVPLVDLLSRQASCLLGLLDSAGHRPVGPGGQEGAPFKSEVGGRPSGFRAPVEGEEAVRASGLIRRRLDDIISLSYSRFYAYLFRDLPVCWRQLYTDASILKFSLLLFQLLGAGDGRKVNFVDGSLSLLVRTLDLALILAGAAGRNRGRRWIDTAFRLLEHVVTESSSQLQHVSCDERPSKRAKNTKDGLVATQTQPWTDSPHFSTAEPFTPPVKNPIKRTRIMPLEAFQRYLDRPEDRSLGPEPLIIEGISAGWPATTTRPWNRPAYLLSRTFGGRRLVPVEIGRSYVDEGWSQKIISFGEFLHDYIDPSIAIPLGGGGSTSPIDPVHAQDGLQGSKREPASTSSLPPHDSDAQESSQPTAYLAQHQLFEQLPDLRADILIPDYCWTCPPPPPPPLPMMSTTGEDAGHPEISVLPELPEPMLNAWFGPPGTITPLHTDPYHNLLAQIVGRKYVRLYAPREAARMRPRGRENGVEMGNTSGVDVGVLEGWDVAMEEEDEANCSGAEQGWSEEEKEEFRNAPFVDCILGPGDTLYIPVGWWHYVRGLTVSFSVSFWWN